MVGSMSGPGNGQFSPNPVLLPSLSLGIETVSKNWSLSGERLVGVIGEASRGVLTPDPCLLSISEEEFDDSLS